jgi:YVTN family beta-propeller protein
MVRLSQLRSASAISLLITLLPCASQQSVFAGECAVVTLRESDTIIFIDTATKMITRTRYVGPPPHYCDQEAPLLGVYPASISLAPDGRFAYIQTEACAVLRFKTETLPSGFIPTSPDALGVGAVVIAPDGNRAFVSDAGTDSLFVVNLETKDLVDRVPVAPVPLALAITPDGQSVYAVGAGNSLDRGPDSVSVIDAGSNRVIATITVGDYPDGIAITPDGRTAYVTNASGSISEIDVATNRVSHTIPLEREPGSPTVSPDGRTLYFLDGLLLDTGHAEYRVVAFDTAARAIRATGTITGCCHSALTPDGTALYVPDNGNNTISVIDTATLTVETSIPLPKSACGPGCCSAHGIAIGDIPGGCAPCPGDCNGDGRVLVDELVTGVAMSLGNLPISECRAFDRRGTGSVTIADLILAVSAAVYGCDGRYTSP